MISCTRFNQGSSQGCELACYCGGQVGGATDTAGLFWKIDLNNADDLRPRHRDTYSGSREEQSRSAHEADAMKT